TRGARGGIRTHTPFRASAFKAPSSTGSDTRAGPPSMVPVQHPAGYRLPGKQRTAAGADISQMRTERDAEDGFTLVELLVVVLILGVLMVLAIPTMVGARERA